MQGSFRGVDSVGKSAGMGESDTPLWALGPENEVYTRLTAPAKRLTPDELLLLFEALQAEEAGHLTRLQRMRHGLEADRHVGIGWPRSVHRSVPAEYRQ